MAARPQEPPSPRLGPDPIVRVFGDTAHNCTPTRAQREKKPGLAVPAEVENIGATLLCVLQDELNSSTSSLPRAQRFRQKWRQNAQHYAYCSGGFVLSSATGDVTLEALPVVNQNQLHACWKMAETGLLDSLGIPPYAGVLYYPDSSSWPPLKILKALINFATELQLQAGGEEETEPLLCADAKAEAVPLLCADAEAEPRRSERIKRRREDEDTPLRQQQGKRMRTDDVQDDEDADDDEDASEADVPEPKAAEVEERDFEETAAAPPASQLPPKKRDQSGISCDKCISRKVRCAQYATGPEGQLLDPNKGSIGPPCAECISRGHSYYWRTERKRRGHPRGEPELARGVAGQAPARPVAGRTKPRQTATKGQGQGSSAARYIREARRRAFQATPGQGQG